jgi:hypothetical protein
VSRFDYSDDESAPIANKSHKKKIKREAAEQEGGEGRDVEEGGEEGEDVAVVRIKDPRDHKKGMY